jgi:hypothetical protein
MKYSNTPETERERDDRGRTKKKNLNNLKSAAVE